MIIMLGSNDILQGADGELTGKRMEAFLSWLPIPLSRVLLVAPPAMQLGAWVFEDRLLIESAKLAKVYQEISNRLGMRFADAGEWGITLAFDGAHFTEEGHKAFAEGLYQALR